MKVQTLLLLAQSNKSSVNFTPLYTLKFLKGSTHVFPKLLHFFLGYPTFIAQ